MPLRRLASPALRYAFLAAYFSTVDLYYVSNANVAPVTVPLPLVCTFPPYRNVRWIIFSSGLVLQDLHGRWTHTRKTPWNETNNEKLSRPRSNHRSNRPSVVKHGLSRRHRVCLVLATRNCKSLAVDPQAETIGRQALAEELLCSTR